MEIAIIGAGITGLTAAHTLTKAGHDVTVYERGAVPGGLGTYIEIGGNHLESFYHHFFKSDKYLRGLIDELGLTPELKYHTVKTGVFRGGTVHPFSSVLDLLRYKPLPFVDRVRCGMMIALFKALPVEITALDTITAQRWIKTVGGPKVYDAIWGPLLEGKFADYAGEIPALWLWGRIFDRSLQLGYLNGSAKTLFDKLITTIQENGGKIILNAEVTGVESKDDEVVVTVGGKAKKFDKCLLTTVSPISSLLIKNTIDAKTKKTMEDNDHLGAVCVILELKHQVQSQYWLNICEKGSDVLVMVEHTNLIPAREYGNRHVVYLANYIHRSKKRFQMDEKAIINEYANFLKTINPKFDKSWILKAHLARVPRTQTIFHTGALKTRPPHRLPVKNLYMANIDHMYPHDRNLNLGVMLGTRVSSMIMEDI